MNEAVQSLGYGLAALLFCAVICAICQMIKSQFDLMFPIDHVEMKWEIYVKRF